MTDSSPPPERPAAGDANTPQPGRRFADYELLEEIGRGGMGVIYRARQRGTNRIVAVKMMQPALAGSADLRACFHREAEAAASMNHPGILRVYEVGETGSLPYFSMRFAEGGSLADALPRLRGDVIGAAAVVAKIARAIHHAHERGLLHRDLKPANVLLDRGNEPMVTDFGLARWVQDPGELTRSLVVLGTAGYVAPEQAAGRGDRLTPRVDVYSLGVILFELLTGSRPFPGENALTVLRRAAEESPPRLRDRDPTLPRDLEWICERCMQPDPAQRYASALGVANDLERWLLGLRPTDHRLSAPTRARQWLRRRPGAVLAGLACLLVAGGMALGYAAPRTSHREVDGTSNLEAAHFFRRGMEVSLRQRTAAGYAQALELFRRAVSLEPGYALAHAELSRVHSQMFWSYIDRSEAGAQLARREAETAVRLRPGLGRAMLALGEYYFRCRREDRKALQALRRARNLDPGDVDIHGMLGIVAKRQHEWQEAIESAQKICELEPNTTACLYDLGVTYEVVRRYAEAAEVFERASYLAPEKPAYVANRGWILFRWKGDFSGLADFTRRLRPEQMVDEENFASVFAYRFFSRDYDEARRLTESMPEDFAVHDRSTFWPKAMLLGILAAAQGDRETARKQYDTARAVLGTQLALYPDDARAKSSLARVDAACGRAEEAVPSARAAAALVTMDREPVDGPDRAVDLAEVLLRAGQRDEATTLIRHLLSEPGYLTIHELRADSRWDFARNDASFVALLTAAP